MPSAVIAGHLCVDLVPELPALPLPGPGELLEVGPLAMTPGGCVANTGRELVALGVDVQAAGDVGDDELGSALLRMLRGGGMRVDQIRLIPGRTTSYSVVVQPPGEDRSFWHHVGANVEFDGSAVDLRGAALLHMGYPSLLPALTARGAAPLEALLRRARSEGVTTSLDLAVLDPESAAAREDWRAVLHRILPLVDVFSPSIDDMRTNLRIETGSSPGELRSLAASLVDLGAAIVMVTAGADGLALATGGAARLDAAGALFAGHAGRRAVWADADHVIDAPLVEVQTTLGAGDAATAGLLFGVLAGEPALASLELAARTAAARVGGTTVGG